MYFTARTHKGYYHALNQSDVKKLEQLCEVAVAELPTMLNQLHGYDLTPDFDPMSLSVPPSDPRPGSASVSVSTSTSGAGASHTRPRSLNPAQREQDTDTAGPQPGSVQPKPTEASTTQATGSQLRYVYYPMELVMKFAELAEPNTRNRTETCGILCGVEQDGRFFITQIYIPDQTGTPDSCTVLDYEAMSNYVISNNMISLGWIHTHPEYVRLSRGVVGVLSKLDRLAHPL
jgi:hypothetical protein